MAEPNPDIISRDPSIKFTFFLGKNEADDRLSEIEFEGMRAATAPMAFYQDVIDFCKKRIDEIPHYEVSDGKLEWKEEKHED